MNKDQPLLNPNLKTEFNNSNSELPSNVSSEAEILSTEESREVAKENYALERPPEVEPQEIKIETESEVETKEYESIPVAYRILGNQKSLLDIILTPWGIFSIILFFIANAIIFVNLYRQSEQTNNLDSESLPSEVIIDQNPNQVNPDNLLNQQIETNTTQTTVIKSEKNNRKQPSNQNIPSLNANNLTTNNNNPHPISLSPPPPANPLNNIEPNSPRQVIVNEQVSAYPDLVTALLSNRANLKPTNNVSEPVNTNALPSQTNNNYSPSPNSQSITNNLQYYVITEYNGIEFLEQLQISFPNALITNIETEIKIQLGVFDNETDAKNLIQELKSKQINAYIYTAKFNNN